jgi:tRNA(fMet)-specific endonuclease VapC
MAYLLDTNACIRLLNPGASAVKSRLLNVSPTDIFLCSIVYTELCYGAYKSQQTERNLQLVEQFFQQFSSLPFDQIAGNQAGQIRAVLESQGTPIGSNDLLIAAIAIANNLTLVTHNVREFSRISSLNYEDWEI